MLATFFSFRGRVGRSAYIRRIIGMAMILAVVTLAVTAPFTRHFFDGTQVYSRAALIRMLQANRSLAFPYAAFIAMVFTLACLSLQVRRLHDVGLSGWLVLMPIGAGAGFAIIASMNQSFGIDPFLLQGGAHVVAAFNGLFAVLLLLWPGNAGPNQYDDASAQGDDAKGGTGRASRNRHGFVLSEPVPEDELGMMGIIRNEYPDIVQIIMPPARDRIDFVLSPSSRRNRKSLQKILKSFGIAGRYSKS